MGDNGYVAAHENNTKAPFDMDGKVNTTTYGIFLGTYVKTVFYARHIFLHEF